MLPRKAVCLEIPLIFLLIQLALTYVMLVLPPADPFPSERMI